jgi:hypothetical protein
MRSSQGRRRSRTGRFPRRTTDRIADYAAWALTAVGMFVLMVAVSLGLRVAHAVADQADAAERERVPVEVVLLDGGPTQYGYPNAATSRAARYRDATGHDHDVVVTVIGQPPAGDVVRGWVDRDGHVVTTPLSRLDTVVLGAAAGTGIAVLGGLVLAAMWTGLRRWLDARNADTWARAWVQVEPGWSGRAP